MTKKDKAFKLLLLSVMALTTVNNIDDCIPIFKHKHKVIAKNFLEENLKVLSLDFDCEKEVDQLHDLSIWLETIFAIMMKVGEMSEYQQEQFQVKWDRLLNDFKL